MPLDPSLGEFARILIAFLLGVLVTALLAGFLVVRTRRSNARLRQEVARLTTSAASSGDPATPSTPRRVEPEYHRDAGQQQPPEVVGPQPSPRQAQAPSLPPNTAGNGFPQQSGHIATTSGEQAENRADNARPVRSGHESDGSATTGTDLPTQPVSVEPHSPADTGPAGNGTGNGSPVGNGSHTGSQAGNGSYSPAPSPQVGWPEQDRNGNSPPPYPTDGAAVRFQPDEEPMEAARRRIAELRMQLGDVPSDHTSRPPER
ncbi:hypothetical protein [Haloactinomyces albus]|uniref:Uncharacterized protein n=1 Tax=Haloactinomyces albus TaxID=1352928 RepID=A0AAE3ZCL3_9ACTN|nr:hypothetical protein [Haloactinomyces albus]MDR7301069.1 hypothetical protein [Haloactinomyces albus]